MHTAKAADHRIGSLGDLDVAGLLRFAQVYAMAVALPSQPAHCPGAQVAIAVAGHPVLHDFLAEVHCVGRVPRTHARGRTAPPVHVSALPARDTAPTVEVAPVISSTWPSGSVKVAGSTACGATVPTAIYLGYKPWPSRGVRYCTPSSRAGRGLASRDHATLDVRREREDGVDGALGVRHQQAHGHICLT